MSCILFAGGGTGGHVFPMIAVADAVRKRQPDAHLVFVGTRRGLETQVVPERGYVLEVLEVAPMRGGGLRTALRGAAVAARAIPSASALLRRYRPRAVFSIGGYAAGPVSLAARLASVPVALMEPNSAIGLANRLIAPLVDRAYVAFPESARYFPRARVLQTGVPIRDGFEPRVYARDPDRSLNVLVLGGSQGAQVLNQNVPAALARCEAAIRVVHQAGRDRAEPVRALYGRLGLADCSRVVPFIDDIAEAIGAADLVIGRSGASAVAEICAVGRPSLLVPYPYAGDHQRHNAESLERQGAARSIRAEPTVERLLDELRELTADPARLARMAESAARLGRPRAAHSIALDLLSLAGIESAEGARPAAPKAPRTPDGFAYQGVV